MLNAHLCPDLLSTTSRYSTVTSRCPLTPRGCWPFVEIKQNTRNGAATANVSTAYSGLSVARSKGMRKNTMAKAKPPLGDTQVGHSKENKECYSSEPKGLSVQMRPTQHKTALRGCSTILHLVECFCSAHWQLTLSTSDTISHLFPNENHFKP